MGSLGVNSDGFDPREFEKHALQQMHGHLQGLLDTFFGQHAGKPVDAIKVALEEEFGDSVPEPARREWAEAIHRGEQPRVRG